MKGVRNVTTTGELLYLPKTFEYQVGDRSDGRGIGYGLTLALGNRRNGLRLQLSPFMWWMMGKAISGQNKARDTITKSRSAGATRMHSR